MPDGGHQLPPALQQDLRSLLHDVRGSVGIVSSTLELLLQEDMHPVAARYLQIVQRQMYRVLMESELFGAYLHFRPEMFESEPSMALSVFTEVQDLIGTNLEVRLPEGTPSPVVRLSPYLLKLIYLAILIPPSGLDPQFPLTFHREGDRWHFAFPWGTSHVMLSKFHWARCILESFDSDLRMEPGRLILSCPAINTSHI
ncbi:hypothetical protein KKD52_10690 [Myxococcota bacterium]|nr:hypothetical protein [Myxococcota bacterium]MBU1413172.1 hypothetical protein [Myxococcota bacterium]MBU1510818.1 hypothetical protein [Myxococcota bacterium]